MTDAFAEFGVERRPWLDPASLRARYHELAAVRHPDKCGGDPLPLARLNEARGILFSPALRLRHLLALDTTREMTAEKFAPDFGLFSEVGMLTKMAGKISGENHSASSPTATAEAAALENKISAALERINLQLESLEENIRSLDAAWPDGNPNDLNRAAEEFSYLKKWRDSLRAARTLLLGG